MCARERDHAAEVGYSCSLVSTLHTVYELTLNEVCVGVGMRDGVFVCPEHLSYCITLCLCKCVPHLP